ncbi:Neurogenic locus notch-like protein 1 [Bienertia sinuspersici]
MCVLHICVRSTEIDSIVFRIKQLHLFNEGGQFNSNVKFVPEEDMPSVINFLVEKGSCVTCWPDANGSGNSILHLLINRMPSYQEAKSLLSFKEISALRNCQDQQGDTPLHIAARNTNMSMVLTKRAMTLEESEASNRVNIAYLRERMSKLGKIDFLDSQDFKRRNILHLLSEIKNESHIMQGDFVDFIQQVLEGFPAHVCQTNS